MGEWRVADSSTPAWVWRRFGRGHDAPCNDLNKITCAMPECQKVNRCRLTPHSTGGR